MKTIFKITLLLLAINLFSQNIDDSELYILDADAIINSDIVGRLYYRIILKSPDKRFMNDCYKFIIPNQVGFEEYRPIKDFKDEILLDTVRYIELEKMEKMGRWEIHNYFSSKKKIFLITNKTPDKNEEEQRYSLFVLGYTGTEKNQGILRY